MGFRLNPVLVVALVVALCAGVVFGLAYFRDRRAATPGALVEHLPSQEGVVLAIDLRALRAAGVLAALDGARIGQEPEYVSFVTETGFDYQEDLDYALAWFGNRTVCLLLKGRFDWRKLRTYATGQGGVCRNAFCRVEGSTAERRISFFPLRRDVMAVGVGPDDWAASMLLTRQASRRGTSTPVRPVWLRVPSAALKDSEKLPAGTRLFARAMEGAEDVSLSLSISEGRAAIELDATCPSIGDASALSFQLEGLTRVLKEMIAREQQTPNPRDLSGVLAAGVFNRVDRRVVGRWPVEREFLEGILKDSP